MWEYSPVKINDSELFDYFLVYRTGSIELEGAFRIQNIDDAKRLAAQLNNLEDLKDAAEKVVQSWDNGETTFLINDNIRWLESIIPEKQNDQ